MTFAIILEQVFEAKMRINLCSRERCVAEHFSDSIEVGAGIDHNCGKSVAKSVRALFGDACGFELIFYDLIESFLGDGAMRSGHDGSREREIGISLIAHLLPVGDLLSQLPGYRYDTLFISLAVDAKFECGEVDIEVGKGKQFGLAQAERI